MEEQYYRQLVQRYIAKKLTDDELEVFIHLMNENKLDKYMLEEMEKDVFTENETNPEESQPVRFIPLSVRIAAAAAILVFISIGLYFYNKQANDNNIKVAIKQSHDINPGGHKAILTLANGKKVILSDQKTGQLATQNSITINKEKDGLLIYDASGSIIHSGSDEIAFNTIETPRGGQYQIILPDGSKAWLNAASSIRFPVMFKGNERKVEITGEVYFEVSHNKKMPFRVVSSDQVIEVLGTHFNINAYDDELVSKTTLLEGSVKVYSANLRESRLLYPGQQSVVSQSGIKVQRADIEEATAWKNGYFKFTRVNIQTLMRQISRWYDVDVEYEGSIPDDEFVGKIKRSEKVSEVLRILKLGKVDFRLEGRKIIVGKDSN